MVDTDDNFFIVKKLLTPVLNLNQKIMLTVGVRLTVKNPLRVLAGWAPVCVALLPCSLALKSLL